MKEIRLNSPLKGQLIELKDVKDPAFASGAMGKGAAVKDPEGKVYSPVDGTVTVLFGTKHAIGIHSEDGADILIHVGIDTVNLGGKYFDAKIEQGDAIKKGQLLLEFDPEGIKSAGYDTTTPVLVTNAFDYDKITVALGDKEITTVTAEPALQRLLQSRKRTTATSRRKSASPSSSGSTLAAATTSAAQSTARRACA